MFFNQLIVYGKGTPQHFILSGNVVLFGEFGNFFLKNVVAIYNMYTVIYF